MTEAAPFTDTRTACACGDHHLPEGVVAVPDAVDERFLHSPALCFLLDDNPADRCCPDCDEAGL